MKTIHIKPISDIFSKSKTQIKKEEEKIKIIADYREKNSLVPSELSKLNIEVEFKELKIGDFVVGELVIERKTVSDFISSMLNRRLLTQLEEINQYEKKLLIIEGIDEQEMYSDEETKMNPNSVRGFLLSILLKYKVPILFTKDYKDTAKFIRVIANKKTSSHLSLNVKKKSLSPEEQKKFILEGFPGIGPTTSKKLLEKFKTLKNIFNSSDGELEKILGKKSEGFKRIIEE